MIFLIIVFLIIKTLGQPKTFGVASFLAVDPLASAICSQACQTRVNRAGSDARSFSLHPGIWLESRGRVPGRFQRRASGGAVRGSRHADFYSASSKPDRNSEARRGRRCDAPSHIRCAGLDAGLLQQRCSSCGT